MSGISGTKECQVTYQEALQFLDSFLNYEQVVAYRYPDAFRLDRMEQFLQRLDNPHRRYPTLHVAGTKGKGSTCAFAASILRAAGVRVGLYTSPHLISFRERIQIDGQPIPEEELADGVASLRPYASSDLTYFEVTTALAFAAFARREVDVAVIEVGMGGRLDATNVLLPAVTAITSISLDHMEKLGNTLEEIAREKGGIIKHKTPVVLAPQPPSVEQVIEQVARRRQAPIHRVAEEVRMGVLASSEEGTRCSIQTPRGSYPQARVPLLGRHQLINAATAVRMVELWMASRAAPGPLPVQEGLRSVQWLGRCQLIDGTPPILLDGAHNADSAAALKATVEELFPGKRILLLFGASLEKDLKGMARILGPWAERLLLTRAQVAKAESLERISHAFRPWHPQPVLAPSVGEALERARGLAGSQDLIVVTGSLFLVGDALEMLSGACEPFASGTGSPR